MKNILVLGGGGFVGRAFCEQWFAAGHPLDTRLRVPTRHLAHARHLLTWPAVDVVQASVHDNTALDALLQGADAVVNLVAILHGTPADFDRVHVTLPTRLLQACERAGVKHFVHVSALGVPDAPNQAPSHYLRSKAQGEAVLRQASHALAVTVLRPSVIFGAHDRFLNLFASMQAVAPVVPLAGAAAQFQPVWVNDVARALVAVLRQPQAQGQLYECVGPDVLSLADLVRLAGRYSGHARPVLPMPELVGRLQASILSCLPGEPLMSADNLNSMKVPNVATGRYPGLQALDIVPSSLHAVAPTYLASEDALGARLNRLRTWAKR
jgi:uncharacterized protein YbjT (DUF2867 family)